MAAPAVAQAGPGFLGYSTPLDSARCHILCVFHLTPDRLGAVGLELLGGGPIRGFPVPLGKVNQ